MKSAFNYLKKVQDIYTLLFIPISIPLNCFISKFETDVQMKVMSYCNNVLCNMLILYDRKFLLFFPSENRYFISEFGIPNFQSVRSQRSRMPISDMLNTAGI